MAMNAESILYAREQPLIVIDLQVRMNAALHQNARSAELDRFLDLLVDDIIRKNVGFRIALDAIESAEGAELSAHVCVIDVAVDYVTDDAVGMQPPANGVRSIRQI